MEDGDGRPCCIREQVRVGETVLLEHAIPDLDLELKSRRISRAPCHCSRLRYTRAPQECCAEPCEVITAEQMTPLVLVPEVFIPVRTEEKIGSFSRPPCFLEIAIERCV